jgi:hypothetical protein
MPWKKKKSSINQKLTWNFSNSISWKLTSKDSCHFQRVLLCTIIKANTSKLILYFYHQSQYFFSGKRRLETEFFFRIHYHSRRIVIVVIRLKIRFDDDNKQLFCHRTMINFIMYMSTSYLELVLKTFFVETQFKKWDRLLLIGKFFNVLLDWQSYLLVNLIENCRNRILFYYYKDNKYINPLGKDNSVRHMSL